jgi:alpha-glucosidase
MVWSHDVQNGGFSKGQPWLPVAREHLGLAVDAQERAPDALLHHYRRAIALRNAHRALARGTLSGLQVSGDVLSFHREEAGEEIFCAFNLSHTPATLHLPQGHWVAVGQELNSSGPGADGVVHLGPWQPCLVLKR